MGIADLSPRDHNDPPRQNTHRILEGAESRLRGNAYLALRSVSCDFRDGVLTLRGCLPTYHLKQMAQAAVGRLEGVTQIVNRIVVVAGPRREMRGV